tara:strand:- start:121 stop:519 length:399 start_codon:yes stop_codon:yes gene_type:complete
MAKKENAVDAENLPRYQIDLTETLERSIDSMIISRMSGSDKGLSKLSTRKIIGAFAKSAGTNPEFLPPHTPLKEAAFRILVANRNKPMSADEISAKLAAQWETSSSPRDISPTVIAKILVKADNYSIRVISE